MNQKSVEMRLNEVESFMLLNLLEIGYRQIGKENEGIVVTQLYRSLRAFDPVFEELYPPEAPKSFMDLLTVVMTPLMFPWPQAASFVGDTVHNKLVILRALATGLFEKGFLPEIFPPDLYRKTGILFCIHGNFESYVCGLLSYRTFTKRVLERVWYKS